MKLFAGPFCGEFGWEIMTWQAHLRAIAPDYDEVIVCCPENHTALYADFASEAYKCDPSNTVKANMWMNDGQDESALKEFMEDSGYNGDRLLTPAALWKPYIEKSRWDQLIAIKPQEFIEFGNNDTGFDVIYHARKRDDWDSGFRNWKYNHCEKVLNDFDMSSVAAIGTKEHSIHIKGTHDLRDAPLSEVMDVLRSSNVFVGPISGPTHLATLCGLPQVTWATKQEHKERIEKKWNPFNTPTSVICSEDWVWKNRVNWHPEVEQVVERIGEYL
jgi:hypothetical protein